jgi:hypothetical protein
MSFTRRMRVRRPMPGLALAVLFGMAACGTDDPTAATPTPPAPTPTMTEDVEASPAAPAATPTAATATPTGTPDARVVGEAWERVADAPIGLTEVAGTAHQGRLWVAGGFRADGSASDTVLIYDPADDTWSEGPPLPVGVHHVALVSTGDRLVVIGGYVGDGFESFNNPTADVWALSDEGGEWEAIASLPEPRGAGAAAWDGQRIVFGGGVGPAQVAAEIYALTGDTWEAVGEMAGPREHLAATSDGAGRTWFLGGRRGGMQSNMGRVEMVERSEITLLEVELTPRGGVGAFWLGSAGACLVGGEAPGGTLALVECVTDGDEMVALPPLMVPRHGLAVGVLDDGIYVALGGDVPGLFVTAVVERLPLE